MSLFLFVVFIANVPYCDAFGFIFSNITGRGNWSSIFDILEDLYHLLEEYFDSHSSTSTSTSTSAADFYNVTNYTLPVCRYYNETNDSWSTDGCHLVSINKTSTTCSCNHLTVFSVSSSDFIPDINVISKTALLNVTIENLIKYPTAWVGTLLIIFIFLWLIICVPRHNDKPIISHMRPWSLLQYPKWKKSYDYKFDKLLLNNRHWTIQMLQLTWLEIRNNHYVLALFLRQYSTNWTGPQRIFCFLASMVTMAATNAAFYGKLTLDSDGGVSMSYFTNYFYSSIMGSLVRETKIHNQRLYSTIFIKLKCLKKKCIFLFCRLSFWLCILVSVVKVPLVLASLFGFHQPSIAVRRRQGLWERLNDKYYEWMYQQGMKEKMKFDTDKIEFDLLGLMVEKDVKMVKGHKKLKAFKFKKVHTKEEFLTKGIHNQLSQVPVYIIITITETINDNI